MLLALARGDAQRALKYARLFVLTTAEIRQGLALARQSADLGLLAALAHRCNNAARNMGALALSQALVDMEHLALAGDVSALSASDAVPGLLDEAVAALRALFGAELA